MKCEICQLNEANIELKQIVEGTLREAHLCEECAAKKGFKSPESLANLLIGGGLLPFTDNDSLGAEANAPGCPGCHLRIADFRKTSRLGCGQCYETFAAVLAPMIITMQRATIHKGKHPVQEDVRNELSRQKTQLESAIRQEHYEEAARLRDRIQVLELAGACLEVSDPPPESVIIKGT